MTLGEKIQELRRRRGMSQDELAEKLDVSRQAISKWERDEAIPETEKVVRIARELDVSTDYLLLDGQTDPPASATIRTPPSPQEPSAGQQVLRGIRRHGYKSGYGMVVCGGAALVIAILILLLLPGFGSGIFDIADGFGDFPSIYNTFSIFGQQVDQMETMWTSTTRLMAILVSAPLLLIGAVLIVGGIIVIKKGKKYAQTAQ